MAQSPWGEGNPADKHTEVTSEGDYSGAQSQPRKGTRREIWCGFEFWGGCLVDGAMNTRMGRGSKVAVVTVVLVTRTRFASRLIGSALRELHVPVPSFHP